MEKLTDLHPSTEERYLTLTEIGRHYGVNNRTPGKWLARLGLRGSDGEPTERARRGGFCKMVFLEDRGISFPVWHAARTLALLEECVREGGIPEVDEGDAVDMR